MADTSYGRTFVRISGPTGAPPLVLLPGAGSTSLMWAPNIQALSGCYQTYAVDNIYDYGRSVYEHSIQGPEDFVNWLDELFDALNLGDTVRLMGISYGGWLTGCYALHFPDRLDRIVLLAPAATVLPLRPAFWVRAFLCFIPFRMFTRSMAFWLFADLARKNEDSRILLEQAVDDMITAAQCFRPKGMVRPTVMNNEELKSIRVPALFLAGENEKIYAAQKAVERLNRVAPQIKTEIIPNAGHDLTFVQADMVNRKILAFLK
jgi:pimeloyl-ACP methyl ester carboxylesterase